MTTTDDRISAMEKELQAIRQLLEQRNHAGPDDEDTGDAESAGSRKKRSKVPAVPWSVRVPVPLDKRMREVWARKKYEDKTAAMLAILEAGCAALEGPPPSAE